jgi:hypothetical protein
MNRRANAVRVLTLSAASALALVGLALLKRHTDGTLRLALAIGEALTQLVWLALLAVWSWRAQDEMERRIMTESGAVAFIVATALAAVIGFLSDASVPTPGWEYVYAMMTVLWVLAYGAVTVRYR